MSERLFIALPLNPEKQIEISNFINLKQINNIRSTPTGNLHVTLVFLGNISEVVKNKLIPELTQIANHTKQFNLEFDRIDLAPPGKHPSMIWVYLKTNPEFINLVKNIQQACQEINIKIETKNDPIPHITLARFQPSNKPNFQPQKLDLLGLFVTEFVLYKSELQFDHPRYQISGRFSFNN